VLTAGIDVGLRKSNVVVLDTDRSVVHVERLDEPSTLRAALAPFDLAAIGVDSPPAWAPGGQRSRPGERALAALGIRCFSTPAAEFGAGHAFYGWMEVGFAWHDAARALDVPTLEVFPNATAIRLAGRARPGETKTRWRRRVLSQQRIDDTELRSIDDVDAALCALTALLWTNDATEALAGELTIPLEGN
jgi:predicted nuclease with RNAse H fold